MKKPRNNAKIAALRWLIPAISRESPSLYDIDDDDPHAVLEELGKIQDRLQHEKEREERKEEEATD